jgi:hypothetical protein
MTPTPHVRGSRTPGLRASLAGVLLLLLGAVAACDILGPDPKDTAPGPVASLEIVGLDDERLVDDDPQPLQVRARDSQGRVVAGVEPAWSVSNDALAAIEAGQLVGKDAGRVSVSAAYQGISATRDVTFDYPLTLRLLQLGETPYTPGAVHPLAFGDSLLIEVSVPLNWFAPIGAAGLDENSGAQFRLVNFDFVQPGQREQRWVAAGGWAGGEYQIWFDFAEDEPSPATVRVEPYPMITLIAINGEPVGDDPLVAEDSATLRVAIDVPEGSPTLHRIYLFMEGEHEGLLPWVVGQDPWSVQRRIHNLELGPGLHEIDLKAIAFVPGAQRFRIEVQSTEAPWRNYSVGPVALSEVIPITMRES